jgi:Tol biopolymer transport system component
LVYALGGNLFAVPFNPERLETTGSAVPIVEGVRRSVINGTGTANYAFSTTGTLVYIEGPSSGVGDDEQMVLADAKGAVEPLKLPPARFQTPRVSRDGTRVAYSLEDGRESNVWIYPLSEGSAPRRLTFGGNNRLPIWSPDGRTIVFQSDRDGAASLFSQAADGAGAAQRLTKAERGTQHSPESWSPDGATILFSLEGAADKRLMALSVRNGTTAPFADVRSPNPTDALFSPDGHWVVYTQGPPTRTTLFVQPFPATGAAYQMDEAAGKTAHHATWSPDGKTLFYNPSPGAFEAVSVTTQPTFAFGNPTQWRKPIQMGPPNVRRRHDVLPDGRFLGLTTPGQLRGGPRAAAPIHVVLNWFEELRARVPAR